MLIIKTTPNLYGITLQGDYLDLKALHESLSDYLEFYEHNEDLYPYHEYEYMLSLNYDIRHAYMGTRNVEVKENNAEETGVIAESIYQLPEEAKKDFESVRNGFAAGNLYFSVEIAYPMVFHYLVSLEAILADYMLPDEIKKMPAPPREYTTLDAIRDRAQIRFFTSLLWENLSEVFGQDTAGMLYHYLGDMEYLTPPPSIYTDGLLHWQFAHFDEIDTDLKKEFLLVSLLEQMGSEDARAGSRRKTPEYVAYHQASEALLAYTKQLADSASDPGKEKREEEGEGNVPGSGTQKKTRASKKKESFPFRNKFFTLLNRFHPGGKPLYEDDFEEFLEKYFGHIADVWEEPNW